MTPPGQFQNRAARIRLSLEHDFPRLAYLLNLAMLLAGFTLSENRIQNSRNH